MIDNWKGVSQSVKIVAFVKEGSKQFSFKNIELQLLPQPLPRFLQS